MNKEKTEKEKVKVGDIRPVYNITGFQVCRIPADKEEEIVWTPVEKFTEAEILSFVYRQETPLIEPKKTAGRPKKEAEAEAEVDVDEEEL